MIGADETDLNVITIEATYTTEDGEDISREHYVMVSDEDIELSVAVDSAEPYYANETYKVTATATSGSDPVDMLWAFDINNIDDEALCYSEIDENGNFFVDTAGTYKITAWADYMMGLKAEVTIDVQPEQIGEVDTFEVTVTDDSTGESWTTVNGELELTPNYQPSYTLSIAENKYKASWFNWELSEDMFGMSSVDVTNTGAYFNFYVDEHDGAYAVVTVTHKEDSSKTATIKVTLDEEDQYSDPQPDGV